MDKIHTQTINVEAIIISKKNNDIIEKRIMEEILTGQDGSRIFQNIMLHCGSQILFMTEQRSDRWYY